MGWRRILVLLSALALTGAFACDEDEEGVEGSFRLNVVETEDTCDDDLNTFSSEITIEAESEDDLTVTFGDAAALPGFLDDDGIVQAEGDVEVQVVVDGAPVTVQSFMQLQVAVRRSRVNGNGRLTYDGTHPSASDEQCEQEFNFNGQRQSLAPFIPTGPAVDGGRGSG